MAIAMAEARAAAAVIGYAMLMPHRLLLAFVMDLPSIDLCHVEDPAGTTTPSYSTLLHECFPVVCIASSIYVGFSAIVLSRD